MSEISMMQTIGESSDNPAGGEPASKTININAGDGGMGDVQAGIEFIYHMREHLVDVGVATVYLFVCYGIYLLMKKYIR
ncbi:MAG: hypothetical protein CBC05_09305 [Crocinitomicaceae bacterium TMED45]|nr:MAG: hypothetical protein CBC05_09305 [Crocinitomicaceae bacterium TMED45]